MTYAELYGNIKKRSLKSDLHNKMILGLDDSLLSVTQSQVTTAGMGDAIANMTTIDERLNLNIDSLSTKVNTDTPIYNSRLEGIN